MYESENRAILSVAVLLSLGTAAPVWAAEAPPAPQVQQQEPDFVTTADQAIRDIRTVGFVDTDGSKLKAIVLSYDRPIPAAAVDASTFAIEDYGMTLREQDLTQGTSPGALKRVYVNDVPDTDAAGGKASGSYVILEVNTDYQTGRFPRLYAITMYAGVTQQKAIRTAEGIILPSDQAVTNYTKETYVGYDPQTGKSRPPESYKAVRNRSRPDLRQRPVHGRHDGHGDVAAQRDNYFAALLPMSCKWGNNFNKEYPFNGTSYYSMPADGKLVWQKDSDGISSSMIRRRRPSAMPLSAASCRSRMRRVSTRRCSRAMSAICRPGSTVTTRRPATTGC